MPTPYETTKENTTEKSNRETQNSSTTGEVHSTSVRPSSNRPVVRHVSGDADEMTEEMIEEHRAYLLDIHIDLLRERYAL